MATFALIHGPNLNRLGTREPSIYGTHTLQDIHQQCQAVASAHGHKIVHFQSNAEHELVDYIQQCDTGIDTIIINPAALTHSSIALRDALIISEVPFIEVHLSNIYSREDFRRQSVISDIAQAVISGLGSSAYLVALYAAIQRIRESEWIFEK